MPPVEYTKEYFDKQIDLLVDKMHAYDPKWTGVWFTRRSTMR